VCILRTQYAHAATARFNNNNNKSLVPFCRGEPIQVSTGCQREKACQKGPDTDSDSYMAFAVAVFDDMERCCWELVSFAKWQCP
jgi:hypothetical protein